jgi:hypothetical protein
MVKGLVALIVGLVTFKATAQGTMLFTWHGQNNYFQASFQCTLEETLPGSIFNSALFTNSIQITSLDGLTYRASNAPNPFIGGRFGPPLALTFILADQSSFSVIQANVVPGQGMSIVETSPLPNGRNGESGFWTYELTPEPSTSTMFILGLAALSVKKRRSGGPPNRR